MPDKKQTKTTKDKSDKKEAKPKETKQKGNRGILIAVVVIIALAVVLGVLFILPHLLNAVPFSTFKSNFDSAARVSITVTYSNNSQYSAMSPCSALIIEAIAHMRKASTIDFFQINTANDSCTYQQSLGQVSPLSANASYCVGLADSEPTVFLNYTSGNYTTITPTGLYVYGNATYMASCPVEIELS